MLVGRDRKLVGIDDQENETEMSGESCPGRRALALIFPPSPLAILIVRIISAEEGWPSLQAYW